MKLKLILKLVMLVSLITVIGSWLRGNDLLTGIAITLLFLLVTVKIIFAVLAQHGGPQRGEGCGSQSRLAPSALKTPSRPPGSPPVIYCEVPTARGRA